MGSCNEFQDLEVLVLMLEFVNLWKHIKRKPFAIGLALHRFPISFTPIGPKKLRNLRLPRSRIHDPPYPRIQRSNSASMAFRCSSPHRMLSLLGKKSSVMSIRTIGRKYVVTVVINISEHDEMPEVHCIHSLQTSKGTTPGPLATCIYNMTWHKLVSLWKRVPSVPGHPNRSQASGWPASLTCNFSRSAAGSTSWRNPSVDVLPFQLNNMPPQVDYEFVSHVEIMKFQEWSLQFNFEKIIAWIPRDLTQVKCLNYPPELFPTILCRVIP